MTGAEMTRFTRWAGTVVFAGIVSSVADAQRQPETVPTAVAEAMMMGGAPFGRPQFFDRVAPTGWPAELIPAGTTVLGGSILGAGREFRMTTLVVSFATGSNGRETVRSMLTKAGYAPFQRPLEVGDGGFEMTPRTGGGGASSFCKDSLNVTFDSMDRTQGPNVFALVKLDGEAGRQNCSPRPIRVMNREQPFTIPSLDPPKGTAFSGSGSSWSGEGGNTRGSLRTTLQADSILLHYRGLLVAAGWRLEGKPGLSDGVAVQRFSVTQKGEPWSAALIVLVVGDRREVELKYSRVQP
jgi:hypothetical protein